MDKLRAQARTERLSESGAGHGWHDLANALLPPPATGEPATEHSIIWFAFHHRDQLSSGDALFVESLTRWRTPLSDKQRIWLHDIVAKIERKDIGDIPDHGWAVTWFGNVLVQ